MTCRCRRAPRRSWQGASQGPDLSVRRCLRACSEPMSVRPVSVRASRSACPLSLRPSKVPSMVAALSPSRAADFMQCPLLYRFRVIDKLPSPPSAAAARGTLVHVVLERLFDLPSSERTIEAAAAMVEPQWQALLEGRPELAELVEETDLEAVASWFGEAVSLIERWFTLEDPTRLEPAERELYVETDLDGLTLRGYVDRLDLSAAGEMRVVDYKTGKAPLEQFEAKAWFQMKFYGLVLWRLHGRVPRMLQLVYLGGDSKILRYCPAVSYTHLRA